MQAAPAPTGPSKHVYTLYIDTGSYAFRGSDDAVVANGLRHIISRLRVQRREVSSVSSVSPRTFALNVPPTAKLIKGDTKLLSVAAVLKRLSDPALLLSGDPGKLHLQYIQAGSNPRNTYILYWYQAGNSTLGPLLAKTFTVAIQPRLTAGQWFKPGQTLQPTDQVLTLHVANRSVLSTYSWWQQGQYHRVIFWFGPAAVTISGRNMGKTDFFSAVNALVDGRTHPALARRLQQEMDAPRS